MIVKRIKALNESLIVKNDRKMAALRWQFCFF